MQLKNPILGLCQQATFMLSAAKVDQCPDDEGFEVALIPHTVANTAFSASVVGSAVNLEIDLVARYVERLLGQGAAQ